MEEKIIITQVYDEIPIIVKSEDGKIYQLNYYDALGRFRKHKIITPQEHNGSLYYRVDGIRYSEQKLKTMEKDCMKKINIKKKIAKLR